MNYVEQQEMLNLYDRVRDTNLFNITACYGGFLCNFKEGADHIFIELTDKIEWKEFVSRRYMKQLSFEEVLEMVKPEIQKQLLFHLDLFR